MDQSYCKKRKTLFYVSNSTVDTVEFFRLSDDENALKPVQQMPVFPENTLQIEWRDRFEKLRKRSPSPNLSEISRQRKVDMPRIIEERLTNGAFTMTDDTIFMEYRRKLYRWQRRETEWFNTGIADTTQRAAGADTSKGLTLAASRNVVYAGKRDGSLFQSLDGGDSWKDITANVPVPFAYFKDIAFAGPTVFLVTDQGVMNSRDGLNWNALTDTEGNRPIISRIAVDANSIYGVSNHGIYRIDRQTNMWLRISSGVPYKITAFAVDRGICYIGTRHQRCNPLIA